MQQSKAGLIRTIQTGRSALAMDDHTYRDMLRNLTGAESCTILNETDLKRVLAHLRERGFTPKKSPTEGLQRKVRSLWLTLADAGAVENRDFKATDAYVLRQAGCSMRKASPGALSDVIEQLKRWLERIGTGKV